MRKALPILLSCGLLSTIPAILLRGVRLPDAPPVSGPTQQTPAPDLVPEAQAGRIQVDLVLARIVCGGTPLEELGELPWTCRVTLSSLPERVLGPRVAEEETSAGARLLAAASPRPRHVRRDRRPAPEPSPAPAPTQPERTSTVLFRPQPEPESAEPLSDQLLRTHHEHLDGLRRGLRTSPLDESEVVQREDVEAAREPGLAQSMEPPSAASLLLDGRPRERETVFLPASRCLAAAAGGVEGTRPFTLQCTQELVRFERYRRDGLIAAMDVLSMLTGLPLWENIKELRARGVNQEAVSRLLWVTDWLRWVEHGPGRLDQGLSGLSGPERRALRRTLPTWWQRPSYATHRVTITRIMETRFLAICPECAGPDGLPVRGCFTSGWLWARNWLSTARGLAAGRVEASRMRLPGEQRAELAAVEDRQRQ